MLAPYEIIIILICGAACIFAFFKFNDKKKRIIENGIEVTGIVFHYPVSNRDESNSPTIRFVTKEGVWMTEEADYGPSTLFLKEGQEVTVIYNAENPKEFIYKTSIDFSKLGYLALFAGLGAIAVGFWFAFKYLTSDN